MELIFKAKFYRDLRKIKHKEILHLSRDIFVQIENANSIQSIDGLKKLRDYSHYYRIKLKLSDKLDYRIVLTIRGNKVWLERITSVKNIFYKQ